MEKDKIISCGSIILYDEKILISHPTNNEYWNIPKGKMEVGEKYLETAVRETLEESNINISHSKHILDLGLFNYTDKKDLYIYLCIFDTEPKNIKCNSYFFHEKLKKEIPEMDDFKWIKFNEYPKYLNKNLSKVFNLIKNKINHEYIK